MIPALILLQLIWVTSLLLGVIKFWDRRKLLIPYITLLTLTISIYLAWVGVVHQLIFVGLIIYLVLYQLFNLYRAYSSHIKSEHLRRITLRSGFRIWLVQIFVVISGLLIYYLSPAFSFNLLFAAINYVFGLIILASTWSSFRSTRSVHSSTPALVESNLPTLTVAIAARNESESLNSCLNSLLDNDYPKLEILVLDDHSTDRRTPEVIRSFAHDGVEFIHGKPFNEEWLAKNWAYQQLLEVANGELVLFCGSDTRFEKDTLRNLVEYLISRNKQMLSVLPLNEMPERLSGRFLQPLRYAWEVSIPRRILHRPPVLATCWLARREFLIKTGSFSGISRRISPESYFAKLAISSDGYSFFKYSSVLSQKPIDEQLETAIRLRYPQLRRQAESVMLATAIELFGALSTIIVLLISIFTQNVASLILSLFGFTFCALAFGILSRITYRKQNLLAYLCWPIYFILDIWIMHLSMWHYELGTVLWKGRSIAPSVMSQNHQD